MFTGLPTASLRLADLLSDPFLFAIPPYQRPYSWTTMEAGQMLDDVVQASGVENPATAEPDYFFGSILLLDTVGGALPAGGGALPPRTFEVVDGQQRLATLTVMLAVLRDLESEAEGSMAAELDATVLAGNGAGGEPPATPRFRLELRGAHQRFFADFVQAMDACSEMPDEDELGDIEKQILEVREHYLEALSMLDADARARLARYLLDRCHVVVMFTQDLDRAHRMFLVLNGRGKPLGRQDILKAEILRDFPEDQAEQASGTWDDIARRLGADNFETLFSHLRVIHGHGDKPVISGVRSAVKSAGGGQAFLSNVLEPMSRAYDHVLRAPLTQTPHSAVVRSLLIYLGRVNGSEWVPSAMQALTQYAEHPERILAILKEIDRVSHLQRLMCRGFGKRVRIFADILDAIKAGRDLTAPESPTRLPPDDLRTVQFNLRDLHGRNQQACKLVLLRLNDVIIGRLSEVDLADYSVEHVVPQRPKALGPWQSGFPDPRERDECIKSLGNLTLIGPKQNEKARNQDFAKKKVIYAEAKPETLLKITQEIIDTAEWRADVVRQRERRLLAMLDELWGTGIDPRIEAATLQPPAEENRVRKNRGRKKK